MTCDLLKTTQWRVARPTAPTAIESALSQLTLAKPAAAFDIEGFRGCRMQFYSTGANNATATWTLYAVDFHSGSQDGDGKGWFAISLGTLAITLSTAVGVDGTLVALANPGVYRFADTINWSPTTYGTARLTYVGGNAAAFSPADNTIAEFLISDAGNSPYIALVCTTYLSAGSALEVNALIKCDV